MATIADLRRLALSFPGAEESEHMGHPDFRVRKKIFATLWPRDAWSVLRLDPDKRAALVDARPDVFSVPPGGQKGGWTKVQLAGVPAGELAVLVEEAWRALASKKAVAAYDARRS